MPLAPAVLATEEDLEAYAWATSLNPKPLGRQFEWDRAAKKWVEPESLVERGLRILRGGRYPDSPNDIEEKRKRRERAEKGIITVGGI